MEYDKIKQLMDDMGNSKLTSIDIDFPDGTKIHMKKENEKEVVVESRTQNNIQDDVKNDNTKKEEIEQEKIIEEKGNIVKSPMVGTFYIKPSPTSDPYAEVGKEVKKGETLCIIEAMKLMNEIQTEYSGKITEILVEDGSAVEYGTPLFRIE